MADPADIARYIVDAAHTAVDTIDHGFFDGDIGSVDRAADGNSGSEGGAGATVVAFDARQERP